jgi:hypothetical protein
MTDQPKRPEQPTCVQEQPPRPGGEWIQKMHDHFRQKGFYRAEDLQRVLGDPREHVEVNTLEAVPANYRRF